jgi:hypothetical protein
MGLLKFLIISILIMWLIKMIARLLLPALFKKIINQAQQNVNPQQQQQAPRRPVGKISVDYVPPKDKEARAADKAGDFIDYEDLK